MAEASLENDPKYKVALVSFPWQSNAPYKFLSELLKILNPLCKKIVVINGNTDRINVASKRVELRDLGVGVHYVAEKKPRLYSGLLWIFECVLAQAKSSLELIRIRGEVDVVVFYLANPFYLIPVITSKLLGKRTIDVITKSTRKNLLTKILNLQDPLLFKLFDGLSPETSALIGELKLAKYQNKLLAEGARFIDTSYYKIDKGIDERELVVGFVGRLDKGKGVAEFLDAIPLVTKSNNNVKFLIGGSGKLSHYVDEKSKDLIEELGVNIEVTGWIEKGLPDYLNRLRLFVLPTYFDAFPTSVLEAMACGAPVLATAKGGIVDVIRDEETGFIMEDNTPAVIAKNITRAISYHDLGKIVANARNVIERKFTYIKAVERWRRILELAVGE
jgi:glycosyltransferase involved in cell wall biosynthesis